MSNSVDGLYIQTGDSGSAADKNDVTFTSTWEPKEVYIDIGNGKNVTRILSIHSAMLVIIMALLAAMLMTGCATNLTTRTESDGTKTTQRSLTTLGMGNKSANETDVVGKNLTMKSGVTHEGKITPEEAAFLLNLLAPVAP